jgi:hypothetical protein
VWGGTKNDNDSAKAKLTVRVIIREWCIPKEMAVLDFTEFQAISITHTAHSFDDEGSGRAGLAFSVLVHQANRFGTSSESVYPRASRRKTNWYVVHPDCWYRRYIIDSYQQACQQLFFIA